MKHLALALVAISTLGLSCTPAKPTLSVKGANVAAADFDGATIDVDVEIDNPNSFPIAADEVSFTASLEDKRAATGSLKKRITVESKSKARVKVPVRLRYADVSAAVDAAAGRDHWRYGVTGEVALNPIDKVSLRLPFTKSGELDAPRLPKVVASKGRLSNISLRAVTVDVDVVVSNDNAFDVPAGSFKGDLRLGGEDAGHVTVAVPTLGAKKSVSVVVHQQVPLAGLVRTGVALAAGKAVDATVEGTFAWSSRRQSFKATLPLSR